MTENENRLTVIGEPFSKFYIKSQRTYVKCKCNCGNECEILLSDIKHNRTRSCGCLKREHSLKLIKLYGKDNSTHKLSDHKLYHVWCSMKQRCYDINNIRYHRYGERGITVCDEWQEFLPFYNWAIDKWREGLILDREDNDGNYKPENCRFITSQESCNNRSTNHYIIAFGERKTLAEWSRDSRCVVKYRQLEKRIRAGWNPEEALTTKTK